MVMFRPLLNENFSEERLCDFVISVLTAPALLIHLSAEVFDCHRGFLLLSADFSARHCC
jgi:hypothetical protein